MGFDLCFWGCRSFVVDHNSFLLKRIMQFRFDNPAQPGLGSPSKALELYFKMWKTSIETKSTNTWFSLSAIVYWVLATGYWLLGIGYRLLAIGYWLLASGYWL